MFPTRLMGPLLVPLAALATLGGCDNNPEGAPRVTVVGSAPKLVNPAAGPLSPPDAVLLQNVAQGLVAFDSAGNIVGGLAERQQTGALEDMEEFFLASGPSFDLFALLACETALLAGRFVPAGGEVALDTRLENADTSLENTLGLPSGCFEQSPADGVSAKVKAEDEMVFHGVTLQCYRKFA